MSEAVDVARPEDETSSELKRIQPKFVLAVSRGASSLAAFEILAAKNVQYAGHTKIRNRIGPALLVNQKWEVNARLFLKNPGIISIA